MRRGSPRSGEPRYRPGERDSTSASDERFTREERAQPALGVSPWRKQEIEREQLLPARRTASPEASPTTAARRAAEAAPVAALAVVEPRPFGALPLLEAVAVFVHGTHREVDAALTVDLGDLHRDLVTDLHDVLDAVHAIVRDLRDAHQPLLPGKVLDERADRHDPRDLALVDLADLGLLREALDHRLRLLAALGLGTGDPHRAVVLELDRGAGLALDRADHLATGADDFADLVGMDLDRLDARRPERQLRSWRADDVLHRLQDEQARFASLRERLPHDRERDPLDLDVHLQRRDALGGAADLEVHVAVVVLEALDVGEDRVPVARGHQAHRDARDHLLDRHARIHERERRTAGRCHRRRAVRLERLADDADRVRELVLRRKDRQQRALDERAVTDLTTTGATHHAHFTDRIRREVVVMHEALGVDRRERVDDLLVTGRPECRD